MKKILISALLLVAIFASASTTFAEENIDSSTTNPTTVQKTDGFTTLDVKDPGGGGGW